MKPRILISGSNCSRENYENAVLQAGGEPHSFYLPAIDDSFDGLLLCGGEDMDPVHFGQENTASKNIDSSRDAVELALTEAYLKAGKPVLGICRGHQVVNVVLGGTLLQDIGAALLPFHGADSLSGDRVHPVASLPGSLLHQFYGQVFPVNSAHHQTVERPGVGMSVTAWSEGGLIEATQHEALPVITVQWHPERMTCSHRRTDTVDGARLFDWLIRAGK